MPRNDGARLFEFLTGSANHGPGPSGSAAINGIDVCVWKPLLATCGRDHTVRIWNYLERTADIIESFAEEPLSVTLHPSGLFVLVGFTDRVRLLAILMKEMRTIKEINVRSCRECCFAKGGHLFALASANAVHVYDTYTGSLQLNLRAHQQAVRTVTWADHDRRLLSVGKDGNVFLWDARTGARLKESMQPRVVYVTSALAGDAAASTSRLFVLASDLTIKSFSAATLSPENQVCCG